MKKQLKKKTKPFHNYTCDTCGKPATNSIQDQWYQYEITKNCDFKELDSWDGSTKEFYCDNHSSDDNDSHDKNCACMDCSSIS